MLEKAKTLLPAILTALLLASSVNFAAAAPPPQAEQNLVQLLQADEWFETLLQAVETAELVDTLEGEGPFTLFAPTDEAFARLPEETMTQLLSDPTALSQVLLYHVVPGNLTAADVAAQSSLETVSQGTLQITVEPDDSISVNGAQAIMNDLEASNGVIHVIDTVLLEPVSEDAQMTEEPVDIASTLSGDERFGTLVQALETAALIPTLEQPGPFTLFAPTNEAFANLPEGTLDGLLADTEQLAEVLRYHLVSGETVAGEIASLNTANTLSGDPLSVVTEEGQPPRINQANLVETDIEASNGVIHVIDQVLLPPAEEGAEVAEQTAVEGQTVACSEDYVVQADDWLSKVAEKFYGDPLAYPALFEATNAAAAAGGAYDTIIDPNVIEIGQVLCLPTEADANMLLEGGESAVGEEPDVMANTIADIVSQQEQFSTLAMAVTSAELGETLSSEGPFTLFAPTNAAFNQLPEGELDTLLNNPEQLSNVLLYHVTPANLMAADVTALPTADSVQGEPLTISTSGETVMINGAQVITPNIQASNGVIHAIDTVLLPPESSE